MPQPRGAPDAAYDCNVSTLLEILVDEELRSVAESFKGGVSTLLEILGGVVPLVKVTALSKECQPFLRFWCRNTTLEEALVNYEFQPFLRFWL